MAVHQQFMRYVVVGLASNAFIYAIYIVLTYLGIGPKLAMTLLYGVGVLQTFVFNKNWSFRFDGAATPALARYAMAYGAGYAINFLALVVLVDRAGLPHMWVQGVMILVVALMLFLLQRHWVFRRRSGSDAA